MRHLCCSVWICVAELRPWGILAKSHRKPASFEKVQMSVCTGRYPRRTVLKHHQRQSVVVRVDAQC